jgi:hypothetical protein
VGSKFLASRQKVPKRWKNFAISPLGDRPGQAMFAPDRQNLPPEVYVARKKFLCDFNGLVFTIC